MRIFKSKTSHEVGVNLPLLKNAALGTDGSGDIVALGVVGQTVPYARINTNAGQAIASATDVTISYGSVIADTDGMYSAGAPTRLTVKTPGTYHFTATVTHNFSSGTGSAMAAIVLNGATRIAYQNMKLTDDGTQGQAINLSATVKLVAGDYVEVITRQSSGVAHTLSTAGADYNSLAAVYQGGAQGLTTVTPGCRVRNSTSPSISNGTDTQLTFDTELFDTDNMHDTVTNTGRITVKTPGIYVITANINWNTSSVGSRTIRLKVNGTSFIAIQEAKAEDEAVLGNGQVVTSIWQANVGDYFEVWVRQNSGGALSIQNGADHGISFGAVLVKPNAVGIPARVTSLPSSPYDGQEIYYVADATNGVLWHLRYNAASASAYKWEFLGGSDLTTAAGGGTGAVAANTWVDSPGSQTDVTVPLAGDYEVRAQTQIQASTVVGNMGIALGATATPTGATAPGATWNNANQYVSLATVGRVNSVAASTVIRIRYFMSAAITINVANPTLQVRPVRVG